MKINNFFVNGNEWPHLTKQKNSSSNKNCESQIGRLLF